MISKFCLSGIIPLVSLLLHALPTIGGAAGTERPLTFVKDIVPILTKANCNTGACHAKAKIGQQGFQLSLLGFEPQEDTSIFSKKAKVAVYLLLLRSRAC